MPTFVKLAGEFKAFVRSEGPRLASEVERKLVNLVLAHFDDVANTTTAKGGRSHFLKSLIASEGTTASPTLAVQGAGAEKASFVFSKLEKIELEFFRGYTDKETFVINKDYVFVFGPNGSGKSSLCEAMEFSLLGYVNESIAKRIKIENYSKNHIVPGSSKVEISGKNKDGQVGVISKNEDLHRYFFIERSRIDGFARLAANTPESKQELIAKLFGLDEFNDFVAGFTDSIEKYWVPAATKEADRQTKSIEVERKRTELNAFKNAIGEIQKELTEKLAKEGFDSVDKFLEMANGGPGKKGRIEELNIEISKLPSKKVEPPSTERLHELRKLAEAQLAKYVDASETLARRASEVNFQALFEAAIRLPKEGMKECPLCETDLSEVKIDPRINAHRKLDGLKELEEIQTVRDRNSRDLKVTVLQIAEALTARSLVLPKLGFDLALTLAFRGQISDFPMLQEDCREFFVALDKNQEVEKKFDQGVIDYNAAVDNAKSLTEKLEVEKKTISDKATSFTELLGKQKLANGNVETWTEQLKTVTAELEVASAAAKIEAQEIAGWVLWVNAYKAVVQHLRAYRENLPLAFVGQLNELTRDIYNTINSHDKPFEKAATIKLPSEKDQSIEISFQNEPDKFFDALVVLSEGHLRCLGLAILVAKNISDGCPVVIFDDVVNAIDSDHQAGIRKLVLDKSHLNGKQVILTTHSEYFIQALENDLPKEQHDKKLNKYELLMDEARRKIRISSDNRHYVKLAEQCLKVNRTDEALYNLRTGLEFMSNKLWTKLGKEMKTELKLLVRYPGAKPDLNSVLRCLSEKLEGSASNLAAAKSIFIFLLGLEVKNPLIWTYLNSGAHAGAKKPEYDAEIVKELLAKMADLEKILKGEGEAPKPAAAAA